MMKILVCITVMLALCAAAPQFEDHQESQGIEDQHHQQVQEVHILKQESDIRPDGYSFEFETSDGTSRQESGSLKQISDDVSALEVTGTYSYTGPDGVVYSFSYTADENGYRQQGHSQHGN